MSLAYIRVQFRVPAHRGRRVTVNGRRAVITGASRDMLLIRFDGETISERRHPTDGIAYDSADRFGVQWQPITVDEPAPLVDVLVSTLLPGEEKPTIFQGWRRSTQPSQFLITGSETEIVPGIVYAFAREPLPAPVPHHVVRIPA